MKLIDNMKNIFLIDTNLELFIQNKYTNNQSLEIPLHISKNPLLYQFIAIQNNKKNKVNTIVEDLSKLKNSYVIVNTNNKSNENNIISNITDNETVLTMDSAISTLLVKVKKCFKPEKTRFSSRMEKLEEDDLVDLSPRIFDLETKTLHKKGLCITHIPYKSYRVK